MLPPALEGPPSSPITDLEIRSLLDRYVEQRFDPGDPAWQLIVRRAGSRQRNRRIKRQLFGWGFPQHRRTRAFVERDYDHRWEAVSIVDQLSNDQKVDACEWRGEGLLVQSRGLKALHNLLLVRTIAHLAPRNVLEVGCGNALHLFLLSARFPEIEFSGVELTENGVRAADRVRALPELPREVQALAVEPLQSSTAHQRLDIRRASADDLPFEDGRYDLVYTSLALEQMEDMRDQALSNVARVARRYVVMIEPFRDWNQDGLRRDYVLSRGIFAAWISDLGRFGLRPVTVMADIPQKIALGTGLVVAAKIV